MAKDKPWYEQEELWTTMEPILFGSKRRADAASEVERIWSMLGMRPAMYLLDLCCGIGRHTLEFARLGCHATGVDRTQQYLEQASKRAEAEGLEVELVLEDMRRFCRPEAFDVVVNMFTSFGYFEDPEDDRRVVENIHQSLRAGGKLLIDIMGKEVLARKFRERDWHEQDDVMLLEERKLTYDWGGIEARWLILKGDELTELRFTHRLYSAVELSSLLKECDFTEVDIYGDLEGAPYDHKAERLVAVALK